MSVKQEEGFIIEGMSCDHCVRAVRKALEEVEGVTVESVEIGRALVGYDPDVVSREEIAGRIEDEGYTVKQ